VDKVNASLCDMLATLPKMVEKLFKKYHPDDLALDLHLLKSLSKVKEAYG
jgi:hypothetical protein